MDRVDILKAFGKVAPIKWDRYTVYKDRFTLFGWIDRTDGQRDFVVIDFDDNCELKDISFVTSSAKYSEKIAELLGMGHSDCIPFSIDFFK